MAAIVKVECIEDGPQDYNNRINILKEGLANKTRLVNQQDTYIAKLQQEQKAHALEKETWTREKADFQGKITGLQQQLNMCDAFRQVLDQSRYTAELLASTLAEERASKRQRTRREQGV